MSGPHEAHRVTLRPLLAAALAATHLHHWSRGYLTVAGRRLDNRLKDREILELEDYLLDHSGLPGDGLNRVLLAAFADEVQAVCTDETLSLRLSYNAVLWLLEAWRFLADADVRQDDPLVVLPACAAVGTGVHSIVFRAAFEGARILTHLATSPLRAVREAVVLGFRRMLAEDWPRTMYELRRYAHIGDLLQHRLLVAAVAEAELLTTREQALDALDLHHSIMAALRRRSPAARRSPEAQAFFQTLTETVGVVVAAAPQTGFAAAQTWLSWDDPDISAAVREGLTHPALAPYAEQVMALREGRA